MQPRNRSLAGAAMAIFALPVFIGLTACLPTFPVPVGNPEKSTIDPYISGIWAYDGDSFWVFEPYDKRTWLLTTFEISVDTASCPEDAVGDAGPESAEELSDYDAMMADIVALGSGCFDVEHRPGALKVWRTRFRGEWFMTWENKGVFDAERGFEPSGWYVWHIDTSVPGELHLGLIDTEQEFWDHFEDVDFKDVTQKDVEKIFRKHADDEGFYSDEDKLVFIRVRPEHHDLIAEFIDDGMLD